MEIGRAAEQVETGSEECEFACEKNIERGADLMMTIRRPLSTVQVSAMNRRLAAIHEAGHFTIARHLGLLAFNARVEKTLIRAPHEKFWIGDTRIQSTTLAKSRMVAVAGAVAEFCWDEKTYEDTQDGWEDPHTMSDSDWVLARCEPGEPSRELMRAIKQVFGLLDPTEGQLWPTLLQKGALHNCR
jgi:hypothetical protein